ncbi:MAG: NUDIX domain-containing protein, partial [Gemmatimonadota bacterium]
MTDGAGGSRFDLETRELERAEAEGSDRPPVEPRPAAGVVLARETERGPEVLLVRRRADQGFAAGAYVFPGGTLDPEDADPRWREHAAGWKAHPPEVASSAVAACRELFEETGVLLASGVSDGGRLHAGAVSAMRRALVSERSFLELIAGSGLTLDLGRLALCGRWI